MIKMVVFNQRKDGVTMAEFRDQYEYVHVPLVRPHFPTVSVHRSNHIDRD